MPEGASPDQYVSYVDSIRFKYMFDRMPNMDKKQFDAASWQSDIRFESVPADYTSLRLINLLKLGVIRYGPQDMSCIIASLGRTKTLWTL